MSSEKFDLTVTGITNKEYFQACRENAKRLYRILAVSMIVICGAIILASGTVSVKAIVGPLVVFAIAVCAWEIMVRVTYKGQLSEVGPVVYTFDPLGWSVTNEGKTVEVDWRGTTKLHKTRDCIFIYNSDASGNLLPRRSLTPEQEEQLFCWFRNTRLLAKEFQRDEDRKARRKFKEEHEAMRFGRRGPSWGPFSRKNRR